MKKLTIALLCGLVSISAYAGGNKVNGEKVVKEKACASCHGADLKSPVDPSYPKLAGQKEDYLVHALQSYQRGEGAWGRNNAIMGGMAKQLSKQDVLDVAAYLSSLQPALVTHR